MQKNIAPRLQGQRVVRRAIVHIAHRGALTTVSQRRARRLLAIAGRREFGFVRHQIRWHKHIRESRATQRRLADLHTAAATAIQAAFRGHIVRCQRTVYFFLRKHRLPPVVHSSEERRSGGSSAHEVGFREWMTTPEYTRPLWIVRWEEMRTLPEHGVSSSPARQTFGAMSPSSS